VVNREVLITNFNTETHDIVVPEKSYALVQPTLLQLGEANEEGLYQ
jgi:hypothetical protein